MPVNWAVSGRLDGATTRRGRSAAVRQAQIVGSEMDVLEPGDQLGIAASGEVGGA